jgi:CheY-like chemotaxis protein
MNVLIAEDTPLLQEMITEFMDCWGYKFDLANNGLEAVNLAKAREGEYDICLMDIDMPVMDGCEATKEIRRQIKYFPIMALSGNERVEGTYVDFGMDDFLMKPYSMDTRYEKIDELTVKVGKIYIENETFDLKKEMPMDQKELLELIELKKRGLTKLKLVGTEHAFVVHKNIQNKISHDLIGEGKEISEFIDRSDKEPGRCHLYKANLHITKDLFIPDELEEALKKENEIVMQFNKLIDKKNPD